VVAPLVAVAALAAYPPPRIQGLRAGEPRDWAHVAIPRRIRRPLHLPKLARGAQCPVSPRRVVNPEYGAGLGSGPAYPAGFDATSTLHYRGASFPRPWTGNKVLWYVDPAYAGPVLVRGHQLDGKWWIGFERGRRPVSQLRLAGGTTWRGFPSYTRIRASGCYAYQIDGSTFSRVIVFRAAP
jgi:hypothetical protein